MFIIKRKVMVSLALATLGLCGTTRAAPVFSDSFNAAKTYTSGSTGGAYAESDEDSSIPGTWTAGGGTLAYSRQGTTGPFTYRSSVLLTSGSTPSTGSTAGLTTFTVAGIINNNITAVNTAQGGIIVTGSASAGGYLLEIDNGQGNNFALLAETGPELLGDEGTPQPVVNTSLGFAPDGHSFGVSVTEDRSGVHPFFTISIADLTMGSMLYSGSFSDPNDPSSFGGTQIGYRVRDPSESDMPSFGTLSLSTPEPGSAGLMGIAMIFLLVRRRFGD
jgi:hypothetical protein